MTQTNYFGHGVPRKVARLCGEMRHNGAGGFWDILSQSSIAEFVLTSPKAGFGEAPQLEMQRLTIKNIRRHFTKKLK